MDTSGDMYLFSGLQNLHKTILTALNRGSVINVLTGAPLSGKTRFCREILSQNTPGWRVVFVQDPTVSFQQLLQSVLEEIKRSGPAHPMPTDDDQHEVPRILENLHDLLVSDSNSDRLLIVIDQAEQMFPATLERIQELGSQRLDGHPLASLLLVGADNLAEDLRQPALQSLEQMIGLSISMPLLEESDLTPFLEHICTREMLNNLSEWEKKDLIQKGGGNPGLIKKLLPAAGNASRKISMKKEHGEGVDTTWRVHAKKYATFLITPPWIYGWLVVPVLLTLLLFANLTDNSYKNHDSARNIPRERSLTAFKKTKPLSSNKKTLPEPTVPVATKRAILSKKTPGKKTAEATRNSQHTLTKRDNTTNDASGMITPGMIGTTGDLQKKKKTQPKPPAREAEKTFRLVEQRKKAGLDWLAQDGQKRFTLQLMSLAAETAPQNLERNFRDPSVAHFLLNLYVIEKKDRPHTLYLFYGSFEKVATARKALSQLPAVLSSARPFVIKKAGAATKSGITHLAP